LIELDPDTHFNTSEDEQSEGQMGFIVELVIQESTNESYF